MTNQNVKMSQIEKLPLTSMDIKESQIEKLKEVFPEIFTEGSKVDWEKLKLTLGENVDVGKERFGMNWPGKADCFQTIQQPSIATLVPVREESIDFDNTQNLFIEGDNLEVLKLLQKSYLGKIKMIYIDPPYNTGNDFIYPDNYSENLATYLEYTGQVDSEGKKFSINTETDGRFHSKWMNMMYPRLFLAKNLLSEDGVIFISIDDAEADNLKKICNEIFGEENFVANLIWKSRQNKDNRTTTGVSIDQEYVLCFTKNNTERRIRGTERKIDQYSNPDNDPRGAWVSSNMVGLRDEMNRPNLHYDLINPETKINYGRPKMGWRYDQNTMNRLISENRIIWPNDSTGRPRRKVFLSEISDTLPGYSSIIAENIFTRDGTKELDELFEHRFFDFPKPSKLIADLVSQSCGESDIILDFFAGSSTTAHAVLKLNSEDGGSRRFICVQLPEQVDEKSEAFRAGFKTISDLSKERIRRVIKNLSSEMAQKTDMFKVSLDKQDLGFKTFKLSESNFKIWDAALEKNQEAIQVALDLHINHLSPDAQQESILYEILLKSGFDLTTSIEKIDVENKTVYSIASGELLICLEKYLSHELIKAIAEKQPTRVICLDEGFQNNDQLKTNAVQIMKSKNVVSFRTV